MTPYLFSVVGTQSVAGPSIKQVFFQFFDLPVTHWQHLVTFKIPLTETTNFLGFRIKCRGAFHEQITTKKFRVYMLPHKFTSVEQRKLLDSDEAFQTCMDMFRNPDEFPPELYVWNYDDESPKKLQKQRW